MRRSALGSFVASKLAFKGVTHDDAPIDSKAPSGRFKPFELLQLEDHAGGNFEIVAGLNFRHQCVEDSRKLLYVSTIQLYCLPRSILWITRSMIDCEVRDGGRRGVLISVSKL